MRIPFAAATSIAGLTGAAGLESDTLQAVSLAIGIVAGGLGLWWDWRERREKKRLNDLEQQKLREELHDLRADGDNVTDD
jgi:hypothetical protein